MTTPSLSWTRVRPLHVAAAADAAICLGEEMIDEASRKWRSSWPPRAEPPARSARAWLEPGRVIPNGATVCAI